MGFSDTRIGNRPIGSIGNGCLHNKHAGVRRGKTEAELKTAAIALAAETQRREQLLAHLTIRKMVRYKDGDSPLGVIVGFTDHGTVNVRSGRKIASYCPSVLIMMT